MKILFVQSPTGRPEVPIYPLGLAYLAGQLKQHELRGLDLSLEKDGVDGLALELDTFDPALVAISLRNIDDSSYPVTYSYLDAFHRVMGVLEDWKGRIAVGGTGFSIYPQRILNLYPRIDFGLPGEAENTLAGLLLHLEQGTGIEGWDGGRMLPWGTADLNRINPPDYDVFPVEQYPVPDSIGVQSRRGCAYGCRYCTYGYLSGKRFRTRPVEDVMTDVLRLQERGVERFQFVDSVFNAPADYFLELLSALEEADLSITWSAWLDESVSREQLDRMRRAGAVKVDFSPDAITDRGLSLLGKRGRSNQLLPAVRYARKTGLQVGVNFFNGNPGEGFLALLKKFLFMVRTRLSLGWKDTFVNIGTIRVYAHSPLAEEMIQRKVVPDDCDFFEPVFYRKKGPADWCYRLYQRLRGLRSG